MVSPAALSRPVWAEIDVDAIAHNTRVMARVAPSTRVCAVVKADGYGHGSVTAARAALVGGASMLAVAVLEEAAELRAGGITAPILLLAEPTLSAVDMVIELAVTPVVYSLAFVDALDSALARLSPRPASPPSPPSPPSVPSPPSMPSPVAAVRWPVHLKVDTGMHRVGCRPTEAAALAQRVTASASLRLDGLMTHVATGDIAGHPLLDAQLARFEETVATLCALGVSPPLVHVANSATAIRVPGARYSMVRCGIALYGIEPAPGIGADLGLKPALRLIGRISRLQELDAGETVSYGALHVCERPSMVATVPIGYADGIPRNLGLVRGEALVNGRRCPIVGAVTMDQLMIDLGRPGEVEPSVAVGTEVVFLGRQGGDEISANEWATLLDTIGYEITTRIGPRVPRIVVGGTG